MVATFVLPLLLDSSLSPSCLTGPGGFWVGVPLPCPGMGGTADVLPWSHHLFTRWKYFCRKPGSTALLQSSSCVRG